MLIALAGCNAFDVPNDSQWYSARVSSMASPTDVDESVNRRCIESLNPTPERVAVVTVRLHRALHFAAFAIPTAMAIHLRDNVAVNFRLCQLRPIHS